MKRLNQSLAQTREYERLADLKSKYYNTPEKREYFEMLVDQVRYDLEVEQREEEEYENS